VRFQDGWHEAKVGEIAGCRVGNGLPDTDPMARPPVLVAPSYVASRAPVGEFGPLFLAEAARRGALEVVDWTQPADTDPRLRLVGPAEAQLRSVVVLGDGAHWIWELAAEHFAAGEICDGAGQFQRAMKALFLALRLGMVRPSVRYRDTKADKPGGETRVLGSPA